MNCRKGRPKQRPIVRILKSIRIPVPKQRSDQRKIFPRYRNMADAAAKKKRGGNLFHREKTWGRFTEAASSKGYARTEKWNFHYRNTSRRQ